MTETKDLQLKGLGLQIQLDDFGTGYSSLSCLHRFPLDVLKIDREFLQAMDGRKEHARIVHTVVVLAHNFNLEVNVEGVETSDQLSQLRALGANYAQGYYLSRPLDVDAAKTFIAAPPPWFQEKVA